MTIAEMVTAVAIALALLLLVLMLLAPFRRATLDALFLDIPYILDSGWRRVEFRVNRLFDYSVSEEAGTLEVIGPDARPYWQQPPFWFLIVTLAFVAYGPTFDAVCPLLGERGWPVARWAGIVGAVLAGLFQFLWLWRHAFFRAHKRLESLQPPASGPRKGVVRIMLVVGLLVTAAPWIGLSLFLYKNPAGSSCVPNTAVGPAIWLLVVLVAAIVVAWLADRLVVHVWTRMFVEFVLLLLMVVILWSVAPAGARESMQGPYEHVFARVALALACIACLSPVLARAAFGTTWEDQGPLWQEALHRTELFPGPRTDPDVSWLRVLSALVTGLLNYPLHVLLLPALLVVCAPPDWTWAMASGGLALSLLILIAGNLSSRWQQMLIYLDRWFLRGTPIIISLLVILFAVLRLIGVQYVSTVLDVAPFGVLFMWIVMFYALFWWFENHVNAVAAATLMGVLGADSVWRQKMPYTLTDKYQNATKTAVDPRGRWLVAHGAGRFAVIGWFKKGSAPPDVAFFTYGLGDLFDKLLGTQVPDAVHDIQRRIHLYFAGVNALIIAVAIAFALQFGRSDRDNKVDAVVDAKLINPSDAPVNLASLLVTGENEPRRPALIVAASGGGTRAALYAADGIAGLGALHHDQDIVLLSGVSGGALAASYFYDHRTDFAQPAAAPRAWSAFRQTMGVPYISDVLEGAMEWRIFTDEPLSILLAESFQRRVFDGRPAATVGGAKNIGLVLNTTLTGHPLDYTKLLGKSFSTLQPTAPAGECASMTRPLANLAGGRLVFTNLQTDPPWESSSDQLPDVRLPYVIVATPSVPLSSATALAANFPPVFPNARVNLHAADEPASACPHSFFVTDGGVLENLGLVSALIAVRSALNKLPEKSAVRDIHIIALEASAFGYDYQQDRGFNALSSGKERLTGALTVQLVDDVNAQLERIRPHEHLQVRVHYLPLPSIFRSRGGFGTHWMAPSSVTVHDPRVAYQGSGWDRFWTCHTWKHPICSVTLEREEMETLWQLLFSADANFCERAEHLWGEKGDSKHADLHQVARWICGKEAAKEQTDLLPDYFINAWRELVTALPSEE